MGKVRTSASFYGRGIPTHFHGFGASVLGNYNVVVPISKYMSGNQLLNQNFNNVIYKNTNVQSPYYRK